MRRRLFLKLFASVAAGGSAIALLDRRSVLRRHVLRLLELPGSALCRKTIFSMGTFVTVSMYHEDTPECLPIVDRALDEFRVAEALMSTFKPDSDVARVNRCAGERSQVVGTQVCEVVAAAIRMGDRSRGIFDVTILPLLKAYGFRDDSPRIPDPDELTEILSMVDYRQLSVDRHRHEIGVASPHAQIDLGGIAKGYAVDRAAQVLRSHGIQRAVIDAGGDIFALGSPKEHDGWPIGIQHPLRPSRLVGRVRLRDQAIATSGNYEQHITVGDRRYGHLFDPRTGCPSASVLSASVIARTSLEADALSTTAFLMGPEDGLRYVCESEQTEGLYVTEGEEGRVKFKATDGFPLDCTSDAA
ncbi:MAG: FAD:protein FMN transferase [Planctomycetota bacterium]|jgi:thiamine biosynthesis lipoprotein